LEITITQNHAGLERGFIEFELCTDAGWTFMYIEKTAYAMACSMEIIKTFGPKELSGKRINLVSSCTFGEYGAIDCNMSLEYKCVCADFVWRWLMK
jgi:hypothetical protein